MEEEKKMPEKLQVEEKVIEMLKTVYDPEIPVNVYDLGLIYKIDFTCSMLSNFCRTSSTMKSAAGQFGAVSVMSTLRA